jgi:hypothetical protein
MRACTDAYGEGMRVLDIDTCRRIPYGIGFGERIAATTACEAGSAALISGGMNDLVAP